MYFNAFWCNLSIFLKRVLSEEKTESDLNEELHKTIQSGLQSNLSNSHTNWDYFRHLINQRPDQRPEEDIEGAVKFFNDTVQWAGLNATPEHTDTLKTYDYPIVIKQKIEEKRRLRRGWRRLRTPESKRLLNTATQELTQLLNRNKNDCIQTFLQGLTPTESTGYSLWKETKKIKQFKKPSPPHLKELGQEARSKKHTLFLNT
jgi:hypothetical protein